MFHLIWIISWYSTFFFGDWQYGLITGAIVWSVGGTLFLIALGWLLRLVGVEYDLQKKEAAYRKILVIAEDDETVRPKTINELFEGVRAIHFKSYLRYLYFNIGRITYLQANVLSAYVFLAPAYCGRCCDTWCHATDYSCIR